jgi:hypothetical protein
MRAYRDGIGYCFDPSTLQRLLPAFHEKTRRLRCHTISIDVAYVLVAAYLIAHLGAANVKATANVN